MSYQGGCACGAIRYEISAEPLASVDCYCRDCQKESGTGHESHMVFPHAAVKLIGRGKGWEMTADSGNKKTRFFCPSCGSPVYMTFGMMPDMFAIRAASLDDPSRYNPQVITYKKRAHAWAQLNPNVPAFDEMPLR